eukprot:365329-Chlamydomonas_euryale.AAC.15
MPVLSAAKQRGSSSGLGAVTKRTPLRTDVRTGRSAVKALSRHVERSLSTTPPSPTSPSANDSCRQRQLDRISCRHKTGAHAYEGIARGQWLGLGQAVGTTTGQRLGLVLARQWGPPQANG